VKAVRVRISGRVQGVWFRAWTERQATALGLDGWVRNRRDGDVEALFAGPDEAVDAMLAECWNGPKNARVEAVLAEPDDPPEDSGFRVTRTE
jgi:acylphosphatase